MTNKTIRVLNPIVFLLCLAPALFLVCGLQTGNLGSDPVATLTHNTGNLAVYFLLIGLGISPMRRLSPKLGWLVRFRRMIGLYAFFYATLHLLTYVFLFSGFDIQGAIASIHVGRWGEVRQKWLDVWPTMVDDIQKRRFIQVGLLSWTILLVLAITSPQRVMRAMGGKAWQTLHRLVYGAAVLAIIHYWWLVKKGNLEPLRDTLILVVLLLARLLWSFLQKRRSGISRQAPTPPASL